MVLSEALYVWCLETLRGKTEVDLGLLSLVEAHQGRPYHNWQHVQHAIGVASMLSLASDISEWEWARIAFALFYHDCVYDPQAQDNEERSAEMALKVVYDEEVRRLILLTKGHKVKEGDRTGAIVVDADLSILAAPREAYKRYSASIAEEYSWLPQDKYRAGRSAFLEGRILQAERGELYRSRLLDTEAAAANMRSELASLAS